MQFLAPFIMVKKGGKLPEGNINNWFFEKGDLRSSLPGRLPAGARIDITGRVPRTTADPRTVTRVRRRVNWRMQCLADLSPQLCAPHARTRRSEQQMRQLDGVCERWQLIGLRPPTADVAAKVNIGQATFGKYPENLLGSRARYIRAFKVRTHTSVTLPPLRPAPTASPFWASAAIVRGPSEGLNCVGT